MASLLFAPTHGASGRLWTSYDVQGGEPDRLHRELCTLRARSTTLAAQAGLTTADGPISAKRGLVTGNEPSTAKRPASAKASAGDLEVGAALWEGEEEDEGPVFVVAPGSVGSLIHFLEAPCPQEHDVRGRLAPPGMISRARCKLVEQLWPHISTEDLPFISALGSATLVAGTENLGRSSPMGGRASAVGPPTLVGGSKDGSIERQPGQLSMAIYRCGGSNQE